MRRVDIRAVGSGNIGATNVWRTYGASLGGSVMALDVAKGFVPALLATLFVGHLAGVLAGGAAMLGHWRPLFLRFARGGKVVATCGGAFLGVAPVVGGIGAAVWIVVFALFRYASVASIAAALSLPAVSAALGDALAGRRLRGGCRARRARPPPHEHQPAPLRHRVTVPIQAAARSTRQELSHSRSSVWRSAGSPPSSSRRSSPAVP